ncbi:putative zinc-type alcohol dehydrogenase-like protein YjmD [Posidoniimonas polymericola]|uniref:Putative zinc-type alcohol dehydrogenase-like protein YjmD n=1 Tax=Posidoniimonas polymericola TaxID=2528002 RepID=A0A5C5YSJ1_9BACT|nr:zinc-binding alcohol dehydrogenase family protein [Posidoniimonas polymericola]TWT77607.1 putative zinc-type alcohol dehydrogenase-like protein YjmD [Posidoniimonas polymericola]
MKAFQITEPGVSQLIELPAPEPAPGEVLLRVRCVGFCGSDLNTYRGANPMVSYPRVPGHEIAGVIEQLGEQVGDGATEWSVGQHVLVFPYTECGECSACRRGRPNCCRYNQTLGVQRDGMMAELACVPASKLLAADGLSPSELALVEPLTVGAHAVARGEAAAGEHVVVFGAGAIGLGAIASAAYRGAVITAVDIDADKLALAQKCGATHTINSASEDLAARLAELTDGHGPDLAVEAVGLPATFRAAVEIVCFAGRVVYIGYAKEAVSYETKLFVMKELDIRGSRNALPVDFEQVIAMLRGGDFPTPEVVSHHGTLNQAGDLLASWAEAPQRFTKIQIDFA